ncbi:hypothetical protein PVK06_014192 [Gossypium arboreum]|nr:hypothetical protein PVK06_014192 [Gossypium arboreum]
MMEAEYASHYVAADLKGCSIVCLPIPLNLHLPAVLIKLEETKACSKADITRICCLLSMPSLKQLKQQVTAAGCGQHTAVLMSRRYNIVQHVFQFFMCIY